MADLSKAIELNPNNGTAYWYRADLKRVLHFKDSCADFYKAAELGVKEADLSIKTYCH
jgi:hypothetical protein